MLCCTQVSELTYVLANVFATLFSKGFGTIEDQSNGDADDITQDAHGTGMGEGAGLNDVSDQITDEDQLLGTSEKVRNQIFGVLISVSSFITKIYKGC